MTIEEFFYVQLNGFDIKPLSVNAFIFNQQALVRSNSVKQPHNQ